MGCSVLLVMPHPADRLLYGDLMQHDGFATFRAGTQRDARRILSSEPIDVVLITFDAHAEDPFAFVQGLRRADGGRYLIVGLAASPELADAARAHGADICFELPVGLVDMVSAVRHLIDHRVDGALHDEAVTGHRRAVA